MKLRLITTLLILCSVLMGCEDESVVNKDIQRTESADPTKQTLTSREEELNKGLMSCAEVNKGYLQTIAAEKGSEYAKNWVDIMAAVEGQTSSSREEELNEALVTCNLVRMEIMEELVKTIDKKEFEIVYKSISYPLLCGSVLLTSDFDKALRLINDTKKMLIDEYGEHIGQSIISVISPSMANWFDEQSLDKQNKLLESCNKFNMDDAKAARIEDEKAAELAKQEADGRAEELQRTLVCAIFAASAFPGAGGTAIQNEHIDYAKTNFGGFTNNDINNAEIAAGEAWNLELSDGMNPQALKAGILNVSTLRQKVWASVLSCSNYK